MPHNLLDLALLLQILERLPRQTAVDLEPIDQRGDGDEPIGLHVLVQFVRGRFVEDHGVVGFILYWKGGVSCRVGREEGREEGREKGGGVPFPFDHFFFCFLPAAAAAGGYALEKLSR